MHPDAARYPEQLELLVRFVEGKLEGADLDCALAHEPMQELLGIFEDPRYPASTNHARRLAKQTRQTLGGLVNCEGIIEQFLQQADVTYHRAERFGAIYKLLLKVLPDYIDPPLEFLLEKIVPHEGGLSDTQRAKIIRERLKEAFPMVDKPPRWIQSADWPIREGRPLVFLGQVTLNAPRYFHDTGAAFLFYDPADGSYETITQFH